MVLLVQLLPFLLQQDYRVVGLTRQPNRVSKHPQLRWIQQLDELDTDQIDYDHLAGESIGGVDGQRSIANTSCSIVRLNCMLQIISIS